MPALDIESQNPSKRSPVQAGKQSQDGKPKIIVSLVQPPKRVASKTVNPRLRLVYRRRLMAATAMTVFLGLGGVFAVRYLRPSLSPFALSLNQPVISPAPTPTPAPLPASQSIVFPVTQTKVENPGVALIAPSPSLMQDTQGSPASLISHGAALEDGTNADVSLLSTPDNDKSDILKSSVDPAKPITVNKQPLLPVDVANSEPSVDENLEKIPSPEIPTVINSNPIIEAVPRLVLHTGFGNDVCAVVVSAHRKARR